MKLLLKKSKKKEEYILIFAIILIIIISIPNVYLLSNNNNSRYNEIKEDINKKLEKYLYVVQPKCQKGSSRHITHKELVYNAGFDKEKLLDINNKSYCMVYVPVKCVEEGKLEWKIYISCNDYEDKGFIKWDNPFPNKNSY